MACSRPQSEGWCVHVTGEAPTRPQESVASAKAGRGGRSCPSRACPPHLHPVGLCTPLPTCFQNCPQALGRVCLYGATP